MAEQAVITTAWIEVEDESVGEGEFINTPAVTLAYPFIKWTDVTGQPSENIPSQPNQYQIQLEAETVDMDAIEADPAFQIMPGTRKIVGEDQADDSATIKTQSEFDTFRAEMLQNLDDVGEPAWSVEELDAAIGLTPDDRPNAVISEQINTYCRRRRRRVDLTCRLDAERQNAPNDSEVGYRGQGNGSLTPNEYNGNRIQQLWTNGIHFTINFRDPITGPPFVFRRVRIIKKGETTPDAFRSNEGEIFNGNTAIRWPTTFEFTPGERYRIKFVE